MSIREPALASLQVRDCMHTGILTTDASTPLRTVAKLMAAQRVHAVAVTEPNNVRRPWGIVTSLDVAEAAAGGIDETAGQAAAREVLTVISDDPLDHAAQVMVEHGASHLIVIERGTGHPCGIISTLDVAAAYAG